MSMGLPAFAQKQAQLERILYLSIPINLQTQPKAQRYTTGFYLGHLQIVDSAGSAPRSRESSLSAHLSEDGRNSEHPTQL